MKFEKLNENKIKIIVSMKDLEDKDISLHDFMSNSIESQELFLDLLEEAEEKIGFKTSNCKIRVEAFAMTDKDFILTITKILPDTSSRQSTPALRKKLKVKRKITNIEDAKDSIYKFNTFDDFCNFAEYLSINKSIDVSKLAKSVQLYTYNNFYYLVFHNINNKYKKLSTFYASITEFASYVLSPDLFIHKLHETGTLFIKNNALKKSFEYFTRTTNE